MRLIRPALCLVALFACTPVDNSGGDPPPGDAVTFTKAALPDFFCGHFDDHADLVLDDAAVDALLDGCPDQSGELGPTKDAFKALVADAADGVGLVVVFTELGGCLQDAAVVGFYRDGDTLHAWVKRGDTSYPDKEVACPADIGEMISGHWVEGADTASGVKVKVGVFNPDLPNPPLLP
jgi:hypothetical protein